MSFAPPVASRPSDSWPAGPSDARRTPEKSLPLGPYASLADVHYVVDEGVAVLRGRVPSYYLKQLAQESVRRLDGTCVIVNELEVVGWERSPGIHDAK
jgi:hypothetical protein